jgi:ribose-phosphate pyrophosphokinase
MTIRFRAKTEQGWIIDSPLTAFRFPAGEVHIKGADSPVRCQYQVADLRGMSHDDLFTLMMWEDVIQKRGEKAIIFLPYLPGARADRGTPYGAELYAEFIAQMDVDQIVTLDPHSPVWVEEWKASTDAWEANHGPFRQTKLTVFPFERIIRHEVQDGSSDSKPMPYDGVIAPDKGAVDRATRAATAMGVPVYRAEKTRNFETGQLEGFHMVDELPDGGRYLLVDDICDGGGTFIGLAKAIYGGPRTDNPRKIKLDLWVTHGVFSQGLRALSDYFDVIHTTNSYASYERLYEQHIHDHDVYELTNPFHEGGFVNIHKIEPYFYAEVQA